MKDAVYRTRVMILTDQYRIEGDISLVPGSRLTDYLCEARTFLAVTSAEVYDLAGASICSAELLNVHRDHIRVVTPLADAAGRDAGPDGEADRNG